MAIRVQTGCNPPYKTAHTRKEEILIVVYRTLLWLTLLLLMRICRVDVLFSYRDDMTQWKAYNTLRVICAVAGWLGSCLFVWKDLIQLNAKSADLFR